MVHCRCLNWSIYGYSNSFILELRGIITDAQNQLLLIYEVAVNPILISWSYDFL